MNKYKGCIVIIYPTRYCCSIPDEYKENCPCINCLLKVTCMDECDRRGNYVINSVRECKNRSKKIGLELIEEGLE